MIATLVLSASLSARAPSSPIALTVKCFCKNHHVSFSYLLFSCGLPPRLSVVSFVFPLSASLRLLAPSAPIWFSAQHACCSKMLFFTAVLLFLHTPETQLCQGCVRLQCSAQCSRSFHPDAVSCLCGSVLLFGSFPHSRLAICLLTAQLQRRKRVVYPQSIAQRLCSDCSDLISCSFCLCCAQLDVLKDESFCCLPSSRFSNLRVKFIFNVSPSARAPSTPSLLPV